MPNNLSVIILTKNAEDSLKKTLDSVKWVDEIIIIDQNSADQTREIAKKYTQLMYIEESNNFSYRRNLGMQKASNPWILYLDADEIISPQLKEEIMSFIAPNQPQNGGFIRENYFLGTKMYPDQVQRLFHKKTFKEWHGEVHETPEFEGELVYLKNPIIHHTHRDITSMLDKTNQWSNIEAKLRFDVKHPPVKVWRIFRIALTEFYQQFFRKKVYRYGLNGWIEGLFQVIDKMIVYIKLWELQQR